MAGVGLDKSRYNRYTRAGLRRYQRYSQSFGLKASVAPEIAVKEAADPEAGAILEVTDTGTWNKTPDSYTYQWLRAGVAIASATSDEYTLPASPTPVGQAFTCRVTARKGNLAGSSVSNAITGE